MAKTIKDENLTPTQRVWKARRKRWAAFKSPATTIILRGHGAFMELAFALPPRNQSGYEQSEE
jgi:hypothetical protein